MTVPSRWGFYTYSYGEGQQALIRFDRDAASAPAPATHATCVRFIVFVPHEEVGPSGLPSPRANEVLGQIEDRVVGALSTPDRLVGVMTYGGMRDFVLQSDAPAELRARLSSVSTPFRTETRESEGWDFFDRKIRPDEYGWHCVRNLELFEQLRCAGSRIEQPHELDHTFLGPEPALATLRRELEADRFRCTGEGEGHLVLTKTMPLEPEAVSRLTVALSRFAQDLGAQYDGWGAAVVR